MFGATTNYPFNFANRNGIPMLESNSVEVTDTNVIINIPNRAFRFLNGTGILLFRLNTEITILFQQLYSTINKCWRSCSYWH